MQFRKFFELGRDTWVWFVGSVLNRLLFGNGMFFISTTEAFRVPLYLRWLCVSRIAALLDSTWSSSDWHLSSSGEGCFTSMICVYVEVLVDREQLAANLH